MPIQMLETRYGSNDGFAVKRFMAGSILHDKDISGPLAWEFVCRGYARDIDARTLTERLEDETRAILSEMRAA